VNTPLLRFDFHSLSASSASASIASTSLSKFSSLIREAPAA
jgi:hypothetical protein